jgi:hypothetical protein
MSVVDPRTRLVNFRLSEAEYERLRAVCTESRARSISEFARNAVLTALEADRLPPPCLPADGLGRRVEDLEDRVGQLLLLLDLASAGGVPAPVELPES